LWFSSCLLFILKVKVYFQLVWGKSESKVSPFFMWMEVSADKKSTHIFGHQSSIFPHSFETCSDTCHNIQWDFPNLGSRRRCPAPRVISGHYPIHHMVPTRPPWTFTCLTNWKTIPESGNFYLPGHGKSRCMLWEVPEQVWKLCGRIED
jgi:hypothetical protein